MHIDLIRFLLGLMVSVSTWVTPQPQYSKGLLEVYGNQALVEANADWHGYDLSRTPGRCGFSAISPVHLGQMAWLSVDGKTWVPCTVVDAVARHDAAGAYERGEIGEISRSVAAQFGFKYGAQGYIYFGECPPPWGSIASQYQPLVTWDEPPYQWTPSFYPYPAQQAYECRPRWLNSGLDLRY